MFSSFISPSTTTATAVQKARARPLRCHARHATAATGLRANPHWIGTDRGCGPIRVSSHPFVVITLRINTGKAPTYLHYCTCPYLIASPLYSYICALHSLSPFSSLVVRRFRKFVAPLFSVPSKSREVEDSRDERHWRGSCRGEHLHA